LRPPAPRPPSRARKVQVFAERLRAGRCLEFVPSVVLREHGRRVARNDRKPASLLLRGRVVRPRPRDGHAP